MTVMVVEKHAKITVNNVYQLMTNSEEIYLHDQKGAHILTLPKEKAEYISVVDYELSNEEEGSDEV